MEHRSAKSLQLALVLACLLCGALFLCALRVRSQPSIEFDEGVYLATFQSIQRGFAPYRQTYLSQPPGFLVLTYPLYVAFGSSLEAARLAVFAYSLVGLFALVWLGWELGQRAFGFLALSALYLLPIYRAEIMTFHGDSMPSVFAAAALAAVLRYRATSRWRWLFAAAGLATTALMIKADLTILPAIALVLADKARADPRPLRAYCVLLGAFACAGLLASLAFLLPFGAADVYENVVRLRRRAAAAAAFHPGALFGFLREQWQLSWLLCAALLLSVAVFAVAKPARFATLCLGSWLVATLLSLLIYRPLLGHHVVFLALPAAANASYPIAVLCSMAKRPALGRLAVALALAVALWSRQSSTSRAQPGPATPLQNKGIELVRAHVREHDFIVCDDGIVVGLSKRAVPPYLTDLSRVRITSGGLTSERFEAELRRYKPSLVLAWADRLQKLRDFGQVMQRNGYRLRKDRDKQHLAYLRRP